MLLGGGYLRSGRIFGVDFGVRVTLVGLGYYYIVIVTRFYMDIFGKFNYFIILC